MAKEAKIVTVFNQKGGAGKTHTTCHLAGTFGHHGYDVLVADLDGQQTASAWLGAREGKNFPGNIWSGFRYKEKTAERLQEQVGKYDLIFVDCAPAIDQPSTWSALLVSDLGIVPTKLMTSDLDALPATLELAKKALREALVPYPIRVLPVAYQKGKKDQRLALERMLQKPVYPDFPALKSVLSDKVAYTRGMSYGATAHSLPNSTDAVAELEALAAEVAKLLKIPLNKRGA